jgi:hypothetical protein
MTEFRFSHFLADGMTAAQELELFSFIQPTVRKRLVFISNTSSYFFLHLLQNGVYTTAGSSRHNN